MIEMVDMMAGIGGAWVGYHAVRLFGVMCFRVGAALRVGAAFREWRYQRPANRAMRQADRAFDLALELDARLEKVEAKETTSVGARVAILEEQVEDLIEMQLAHVSPNYGLSDGMKKFRQKYDKKKDLPN